MADANKQIGALQAERDKLNQQVQALTDQLAAANAKLAEAQAKIAMLQSDLDKANSEIVALKGERDRLTQQVATLTGDLDKAKHTIAEDETKIAGLQDQVAKLTAELDAAKSEIANLRCKVDQLGAQRSEFFAGLLKILGNTKDVAIMGDRFVVPSSVFFKVGSDAVSKDGEETIQKVATLVIGLQDQIPTSIDWVLQVNGHADKQKISGSRRFANNWQLSAARAVAVVMLLQEGHVLPQHLAAAGFGEYQPRADGSTQADYAMNRRIEFKLTDDGPFKGPTATGPGSDGQCPSLVSQL